MPRLHPKTPQLRILNEFTKDVDAFRLSHYFYKQKDTKGGKLISGPPWDYNLTFGNNDFTTNFHKPENWIHTHRIAVYWWQRALEDPWFANQLHCRWDGVYATVMSLESMNEMSYLRDWIGDRLNWINDRWGGMI